MFTWSYWIVVVVIGLIVIAVVYSSIFKDFMSRKEHAGYWITTLLVAGLMYNAATIAFSTDDRFTSSIVARVNDSVVAEEYFGFKPNEPYPLVLGSQVASFQASADAEIGFFSSAQASASGSPTITVAFTHSDTTYTLSLPRNATPIKIDDSKTPQMIIHLLPQTHTAGGYLPLSWSECDWRISNLAIACQKTRIFDEKLATNAGVREAGLGKLVSEAFQSAELTMTSRMYQQMIGEIR